MATRYRLKRQTKTYTGNGEGFMGTVGNTVSNVAGGALNGVGRVMDSGVGTVGGTIGGAMLGSAMGGGVLGTIGGGLIGGTVTSQVGKGLKRAGQDMYT